MRCEQVRAKGFGKALQDQEVAKKGKGARTTSEVKEVRGIYVCAS